MNSATNSAEIINNIEKYMNEDELKIMKFVKSAGRITRKEVEETQFSSERIALYVRIFTMCDGVSTRLI